MRKIEYIFIESDDDKSGRRDVPNFGYHYVVNRWSRECNPSSLGDGRVATEVSIANSEGIVLHPTDISLTVDIIQGPIYDPDKYNRCSIGIKYNGKLSDRKLRPLLIHLLLDLRKHFPEAKILGVSEIDGRELYCKNIIVSDAMNVLRREMSDLP